MKYILITLAILYVIGVVFVWCACAIAGKSDARMEKIFREKEDELK